MGKKLIEVALPLDAINAASAREKSIRHGHPSTLHLWWARRPLAAARAVIWASLVDDPSAHPEQFPTEEAQTAERQRLFNILEQLVVWENSNNENVLNQAKAEILKSTNGNPPALLDPFAGGGSIPLEAQRLGLEAHAHDLNPVAVMINKAMIEIPPKFAGQPPVNPEARDRLDNDGSGWKGAAGLAEDVRYYGEWMKQEAFRRIGHLYPKVKDEQGQEHTVIAWIWARTMKCPNPACECEMPLISSFVLSKKKENEAWVKPIFENGHFHFQVHSGKYDKTAENGTKQGKKALFCCPVCKNGFVNGDYADKEANSGRMGSIPIAIVAENKKGRIYLAPDELAITETLKQVKDYFDTQSIDKKISHAKCRGTFASNAQGRRYGFFEFKDYFTLRQLIALTTFSELVGETQRKVVADGGSEEYGQAVGVYLAFVIDKLADYHSSICSWHSSKELIRNTFGRQAIPMVWDYAEANPFSNTSGCFNNMLDWVVECIQGLPALKMGNAFQYSDQFPAQLNCGFSGIMVSTDPPYYDNIGYADLSDFFYVWMRRTLKETFSNLFQTMVTPKKAELIASPYRHGGSKEKAKEFFEKGIFESCKNIYTYVTTDIPVTIYYAYKQSETEDNGNSTASTGWETMLSGLIQAGFAITGTWPMRTEMANRSIGNGTNALASSIVLVCRKRPADAPSISRRNFLKELHRELKPALETLQQSNIAPVDLAQSAIGPGMAVFSRYTQVLGFDGTPMSVREALQIINQELDFYLHQQDDELDRESRFCVDLYTQYAFNDIRFGDADTLARAKNTSVAALVAKGVLSAEKGWVHLLLREELSKKVNSGETTIWLLAQQLTYAMEKGGRTACAQMIASLNGNAEPAKALAYRLYTIAEQRNWTQEAYAYNSLVAEWSDIQLQAMQLQKYGGEQTQLDDMDDEN